MIKIDRKEAAAFLISGVWNTIFGYGVYAFFVWLLTGVLPAAFMFASIISTVFSITNSFFVLKFFVFKTKGNYLKEYIRCWGVYGAAGLINLALLPVAVWIFNILLLREYLHLSPYLAGLALLGIVVIFSFFGHKNITFCKKENRGEQL